ncbi:hypothetical protein SDC9_86838 [bioreactor metagenome]|uniref:Uncharacterized protein n=1 Tax=bioreactor metagenome TaxID=1076179 RepID=A0A644ZIM6_9ZZZZ
MDERQNQDHAEEQERHGGCIAHVKDIEPAVVDVVDQNLGAEKRTTLGHDVDLVEHLERADEVGDDDKAHRRHQQGKGDGEELTHPPRPIDLGCLIEAVGDGVETGKDDHHVESEPAPDTGKYYRGHGCIGISQKVLHRQAQTPEIDAYQPDVPIEEKAENDCHNRHRGNGWQKEQALEEA